MSETAEPNYAELARSRDERWAALATALAVKQALGESETVQIIIKAVADDQDEAIGQLSEVNPADIGRVSQLQAIIRIARTVRLALQTMLERGKSAEASLREDDERQEHSPV